MNKIIVQFNKEEVQSSITKLAERINHLHGSLDCLLCIPILKGGMYFAVDLTRQLTMPIELGVIATSHYSKGTNSKEPLTINYIDCDVEGKHVLLMDEICFTGETLKQTVELLLQKGAKAVYTAVLIFQRKDGRVFTPDYYALNYYGEEWLVGMGMDQNGAYRNYSDIIYIE